MCHLRSIGQTNQLTIALIPNLLEFGDHLQFGEFEKIIQICILSGDKLDFLEKNLRNAVVGLVVHN